MECDPVVSDPVSEPVIRGPAEVDTGSVSLTIVLLAPVVVVLMFLGFQAALWNHARAAARVVARDVAVLVARDGLSVGQATAAGKEALAGGVLRNVHIDVTSSGEQVIVSIRGDAPGILRGTSRAVIVAVALPVEGWVPL